MRETVLICSQTWITDAKWPLGTSDNKGLDVEKTILRKVGEAIARFSLLAATLGRELAEMDLNPIIAGPEGAWAVDALVVPATA